MKKYFVKYPRNFANEYDLVYTTTADQAARAAAQGYERITRADALKMCSAEKRRRRENPDFAGYAPITVYPLEA